MKRDLEPSILHPVVMGGLALLGGLVGAFASVLALGFLGEAPEPAAEREPAGVAPIEIAPAPEPVLPPEPQESMLPPEPTNPLAPAPTAPLEPSALPPSTAGLEQLAGLSDLPALGSGLPAAPGGSTLPRGGAPAERRGELTPARPLRRPQPRYPARARREGIEGQVTVRLRVSPAGRVSEVLIVSAEPEGVFEDVARETARRYRFEPAREGEQAVATTVEQRILFRLQ